MTTETRITTPIVRLSERVLETVRRHASAAYPYECCGALSGAADGDRVHVAEALELPNIVSASGTERPGEAGASGASPSDPRNEEGPRRRFRVSAADYRQSEARARELGAELVGFYHSHPDHPARPSQYDLDHAWPNFSYVIIAVAEGRPGDIRSWRLRPDRSQFDEETLS